MWEGHHDQRELLYVDLMEHSLARYYIVYLTSYDVRVLYIEKVIHTHFTLLLLFTHSGELMMFPFEM